MKIGSYVIHSGLFKIFVLDIGFKLSLNYIGISILGYGFYIHVSKTSV
jgi:hypothetical protein